MRAVADGRDPEATPVEACMTFEARTATTNWDLDTAAEAMINGHFRHLLVVDEKGRMVGWSRLVHEPSFVHDVLGASRERVQSLS
jgi:CBS domain-containing protein